MAVKTQTTSDDIDRSTPEGEARFRKLQKHEEIQQIIGQLPPTIEGFITDPKWKRNANKNFVFNGIRCSITVRKSNGGFGWTIAGGMPTHGKSTLTTEKNAQRDVWQFLQRFKTPTELN